MQVSRLEKLLREKNSKVKLFYTISIITYTLPVAGLVFLVCTRAVALFTSIFLPSTMAPCSSLRARLASIWLAIVTKPKPYNSHQNRIMRSTITRSPPKNNSNNGCWIILFDSHDKQQKAHIIRLYGNSARTIAWKRCLRGRIYVYWLLRGWNAECVVILDKRLIPTSNT